VSGVHEHLTRRIRFEGPISTAAFMAEALGHPQFGYYMRGDPFGRAGDFITAPETSQMFGELLGLWCAEIWRLMDRPDPFVLAELGPGRGTLMTDVLRAGQVLPGFADAAAVCLVETSPSLRATQERALEGRTARWFENLLDVPEGPLILLANEFFDALPVHQFERRAEGWRERLVAADSDGFVLTLSPRASANAALIPQPVASDSPDGAIAEVAPASISIAATIAKRIALYGGAALIVDYGHADHRTGETLQGIRGHETRSFLENPGETDLSAHVDFAALTEAARHDCAVYGPIPQGALLQRLGIEARANQLLAKASENQAGDIEAALHRLIDPAEMGSLFKALAIAHPDLAPPPAFEDQQPASPHD
jgi:NADH dehydrogenase [ubiquinone] 1 alpha subcomplex assembly factor 7